MNYPNGLEHLRFVFTHKTFVNNMTENFSTYFARRDHINSKDIVVVNGTYCCV